MTKPTVPMWINHGVVLMHTYNFYPSETTKCSHKVGQGLNLVLQSIHVSMYATKFYKTFSCSIQLSMKFQLFTKKLTCCEIVLVFKLLDAVFNLLINVRCSVGIVTFMNRINFMLS